MQSHRRKKASNWHQARELRNQDRHVFLQARTAVYEQHMSGRSFDAAIGLFREAEEHRNLISPERCRDMVLVRVPRYHAVFVCVRLLGFGSHCVAAGNTSREAELIPQVEMDLSARSCLGYFQSDVAHRSWGSV